MEEVERVREPTRGRTSSSHLFTIISKLMANQLSQVKQDFQRSTAIVELLCRSVPVPCDVSAHFAQVPTTTYSRQAIRSVDLVRLELLSSFIASFATCSSASEVSSKQV